MKKQWFVLHTLTGQEMKVKRYVEAQVKLRDMAEYVGEIVVPSEKVSETKNNVKRTFTRKFFPGYAIIHCVLYTEDRKLNEPTWRFFKDTPGIIGFVGGDRPVPLSEEEVHDLMNSADVKKEKPRPKVVFEPGETVKINDGPFMNFSGTVDEVDPDRGKLKVSVAIFGRTAPVELEYWQVEREGQKPAGT